MGGDFSQELFSGCLALALEYLPKDRLNIYKNFVLSLYQQQLSKGNFQKVEKIDTMRDYASQIRYESYKNGRQEARLETMREVAITLLAEGVNYNFIKKVTKFSVKEIQALDSAQTSGKKTQA
jgi:hypothetical protein